MSVERAALVGIVTPSSRGDADVSLDELAGLADAAGASVVLRMLQERPKPDPATFIGAGKVASLSAGSAVSFRCLRSSPNLDPEPLLAEEKAASLSAACAEADIDLVIFDNELTP